MRPNIILLITHDQGIAASPFAGAGQDAFTSLPTPNHQRLAASGTIFTNHFGTAPMCSPARGSLFTGLYPHQNGLVGLTHRGFKYHEHIKTVVELLRDSGYNTVLAGMQHESVFSRRLGYQKHVPLKLWRYQIKRLTKQFQKGKPFFLCIGTQWMHRSWEKPPKCPVTQEEVEIPSYLPQDNDKIRTEVSQFISRLKYYDQFLGKVLDYVDKIGIRDNTIIIQTTDHGIAHAGAKGLLYEPGCHTMMIFSGYDILKGVRRDALISGIDFAPTICDLCGIPSDPQFIGKSYVDLLKLQTVKDEFREFIINETTFADIYNPIRSIRTQTFRYIRNYVDFPLINAPPRDIKKGISFPDWQKWITQFGWDKNRNKEELYNIKLDCNCRKNLVEDKDSLNELNRLRLLLNDHLKGTNDPIVQGFYPAPELSILDNQDQYPEIKKNKIK